MNKTFVDADGNPVEWDKGGPRTAPPDERQARALGCTCEWWGRGAIISFDDSCPIADRHMRPEHGPDMPASAREDAR